MARSVYLKNNVLGTLAFADGTGSPVTLTATFDKGDVSISAIGRQLNEVNAVTGRGKLRGLTVGERVIATISFTADFAGFTGSPMEFVNKKGDYSANVSTLAGSAYTVDATLTIEGTDIGDPIDDVVIVRDVYFTVGFGEGGEVNTLSFEGNIYGTIDINGETYSEVA